MVRRLSQSLYKTMTNGKQPFIFRLMLVWTPWHPATTIRMKRADSLVGDNSKTRCLLTSVLKVSRKQSARSLRIVKAELGQYPCILRLSRMKRWIPRQFRLRPLARGRLPKKFDLNSPSCPNTTSSVNTSQEVDPGRRRTDQRCNWKNASTTELTQHQEL